MGKRAGKRERGGSEKEGARCSSLPPHSRSSDLHIGSHLWMGGLTLLVGSFPLPFWTRASAFRSAWDMAPVRKYLLRSGCP